MSLKGYIDLYEDHAESIKKNSAELLNCDRDSSFSKFKSVGFPTKQGEDYMYNDYSSISTIDYGVNINKVKFPIDPDSLFRCDIPSINGYLYYLVNDMIVPSKSLKNYTVNDGLVVKSLSEACVEHKDVVEKYLSKSNSSSEDPFVLFNKSFAQDGLFLYVKKGVKVANPLQLISVMRSDVDLLTNTRILIVLEEGASLDLVGCDHVADKKSFFSNKLVEIYLEKGANLRYINIESSSELMTNMSNMYVDGQENSSFSSNIITLNNGKSRFVQNVNLNGKSAKCDLRGLTFGEKEHNIENSVFVNHNVGNTYSQQVFKTILDESAEAYFTGKIFVAKNAQKIDATQISRSLCLSKTAKVKNRPQMEIYADDVKCSHGATVGQLDETALFYMQQRGIGRKEAITLLMSAFAFDVLDNITSEPLKDRMKMLVEKRVRNESSICGGCLICK